MKKRKIKILIRILGLATALMSFVNSAEAQTFQIKDDSSLSNYLAAIYAREHGDQNKATQSYMRLLDEEPINLKVLEEAFSYFIFVGDFDNAFKVVQDHYSLSDENVASAMLLALRAFKKKRVPEMNMYLERVTGFGFDTLMTPLMQAWALAREGKTNEGLARLEELLGNDPFEPFYAEHQAFILDYDGRKEEAEKHYLNLINRTEVTSLQPVLNYSAMLQASGREDDARLLLDRFLLKIPASKQLQAAIQKLEKGKKLKSIAKKPEHALAIGFLRTGIELGRDRALLPAIVYTRFATFLHPKLDEAHLFLGNLFSSEDYPELAFAAFDKVNKKGPFLEAALLRQAFVMSGEDNWDGAITLVEEFLVGNPDSVQSLIALGDLYRNQEKYAEALPYYERSITLKGELEPQDWFLLFTRAICYERLERWEEAEADFRKTLEFNPDEPDVLNYLGYSWIDRGINLEEGRAMIEKAVEQRPNSGAILDSLGWAQYLMEEYEEAVENLERAILLEPGDPTINDHLGDAYWKAGREREARFQWDHALKLDPPQGDEKKIALKIEYGLALAESLQDQS